MSGIDTFFEKIEEPNKGIFLFLIKHIKNFHPEIQLYYKWKLPYLYFKEKPLCYFWKDKNTNQPYIGFARGYKLTHPSLEAGNRTTIKILPIATSKDIDLKTLDEVLNEAILLY